MTNTHINMETPAKKNHYFETVIIIAFAISFIPQYGHARNFRCGYVTCDSSFQHCDHQTEGCVPCTDVCDPYPQYCEELCPDYYNNHNKKFSTQKPVTEEVDSVTANIKAKESTQSTNYTDENSTIPLALYVVIGVLAFFLLLVLGVGTYVYKKKSRQSHSNNGDGGQVSKHNSCQKVAKILYKLAWGYCHFLGGKKKIDLYIGHGWVHYVFCHFM